MPEKKPAVTVIIATYNRSRILRCAIQSVLNQDFPDFELWIIGDGCSDQSEEVVSGFADKRLHWLNLPENNGTPSMPRNEGLRRARGAYIAHLGHDDLWFPWHLSQLVTCIERNDCDFAYSLAATLEPEGVTSIISLPERTKKPVKLLSPSNWLLRKTWCDSIGPWSQKVRVKIDLEYLQRAWTANTHFCFNRQLSVLKFPSAPWQMYRRESAFPQERYIEALASDAQALRLELLHNLASEVSKRELLLKRGKGPVREGLKNLLKTCLNAYGFHRWPLNQILYRRWRRKSGIR